MDDSGLSKIETPKARQLLALQTLKVASLKLKYPRPSHLLHFKHSKIQMSEAIVLLHHIERGLSKIETPKAPSKIEST